MGIYDILVKYYHDYKEKLVVASEEERPSILAILKTLEEMIEQEG